MRRYSFDEGPEVNQGSGEWVKYADVQAWLEGWHKKAIRENDCDAEPIIAELLADLARDGEQL